MTPPDDPPPPPDDDQFDYFPDDEDDDPVVLPRPMFVPTWSGEVKPAERDVRWVWDGYLAEKNITVLTSQAKTGKTTLLSTLLAHRLAGGTFAGRALRPGRSAVVCEEDQEHWELRRRTLDFGNDVAFFFRPIQGRKPTMSEWLGLLDSVGRLGLSDVGVDLAIFDPLAAFLPGRCENNADLMMEALLPLERLQKWGMAVALLHHPRKGRTLAGQAARGSGALLGHADIVVEMHPYSADDADRRRVLRAWSHHPATPRQLVIEWAADGTDYLARGTLTDEEFREHWLELLPYFASAPSKLTRRELRNLLPTGRGAPTDRTLWRWLERAVAAGLLLREGSGHKTTPFRYWLPEREAEWMKDPLYLLAKIDEEARAKVERLTRRPPGGE
jgi:hypothetical protein